MSSKFTEIGSEFWIENEPNELLTERDGVYAISGRTAIDLILQVILRERQVRSVAMPAWCCDSMLAPFVARGIELRFYDVFGHTDFTDNTDVFYLTNYFGYEDTLPVETVKRIKERGSIILYDRTHSFLMEDREYCSLSDYSFASIRKWMGVIGGAVVEGLRETPVLKDCPYVSTKEVAMRDKWRYLQGDANIVKQDFMNAFGEFGHHLAKDYQNYEMDSLSYTIYKQTDLNAMRITRRQNAAYLHDHLKGVRFLGEMTDGAVPLFVPVFFESKEKRDAVRKRLIDNQIYCPVHWPKPQQIPADCEAKKIYDTALSLICDQRYGLAEMERIVTQILQITQN